MKIKDKFFVHVAGLLSTVGYLLLCSLSNEEKAVPLGWFMSLMAWEWGLCLFAYFYFRKGSRGNLLIAVVLWGIAFRIIGLMGSPVLEDDYYRYLWDGYQFLATGNPYDRAPAESFGDEQTPERFKAVLDGVNHPEVPTIYGPVCQVSFALSAWIDPGHLWPLKLLLVVADLLIAWILCRMVTSAQLLLYLWCPLLIKEVAFTGHIDVLGTLFIMLALRSSRWHPKAWSLCFLALSVGIKLQAILLLPFFLKKERWFRQLFTFASFCLLIYFPFFIQRSLAGLDVLFLFMRGWEFNSSVYALMGVWLGPPWPESICLVLFAFAYLLLLAIHHPKIEAFRLRGDLVFALLFLFSPVVNAWYLIWMVPFIVLCPTYWGITALASVTLTYIQGQYLLSSDLSGYDHPWWIRPAEFGLIGLGLLLDRLRAKHRIKNRMEA